MSSCVIKRLGVKAVSRIKASPLIWDGGVPCDYKACSAEQWPSTCHSAVLCCRAEAEARGFLCLSGRAGLCIYQCVQSSMKVIWHVFFFIYMSPGSQVFWAGGGGGSSMRRARQHAWQQLKHQHCRAPSEVTGGWRPDYYCLKSHR